jgi:hypothetical protein
MSVQNTSALFFRQTFFSGEIFTRLPWFSGLFYSLYVLKPLPNLFNT